MSENEIASGPVRSEAAKQFLMSLGFPEWMLSRELGHALATPPSRGTSGNAHWCG